MTFIDDFFENDSLGFSQKELPSHNISTETRQSSKFLPFFPLDVFVVFKCAFFKRAVFDT